MLISSNSDCTQHIFQIRPIVRLTIKGNSNNTKKTYMNESVKMFFGKKENKDGVTFGYLFLKKTSQDRFEHDQRHKKKKKRFKLKFRIPKKKIFPKSAAALEVWFERG